MNQEQKRNIIYRKEWRIIPLRKFTKIPIHSSWNTREFNEKELDLYLNELNSNIGLVLGSVSGNIIDIDIDDPIAANIIERNFKDKAPIKILPFTFYTFGRDSKPLSHILYKCGDTSPKQFKDFQGNLISEIRGENQQTRIPESTHLENGVVETVRWYNPRLNINYDLIRVDRKRIEDGLELLTILTTIAKRWKNANGSRHNLALDISGVFLKKYRPEDVKYFIELICNITNDEEMKDRLKTVDYTKLRIENNLPYTKYKTVMDLFGEGFVNSLKTYFNFKPLPTLQEVTKTNQQEVENKTQSHIQNNIIDAARTRKSPYRGFDPHIYSVAFAEKYKLSYDSREDIVYYWDEKDGIWKDADNMVRVFCEKHAKNVLQVDPKEPLYPNSEIKHRSIINSMKSKLATDELRNFRINEIDNTVYVPFNNCAFNLETKSCEKYSPEMGFKFKLRWNYTGEITNDALIKIVQSYNEDIQDLLFEIMAFPMYRGDTRSKIFFLNGRGKNGKSTYCKIMSAIYKDFTVNVSLRNLKKDLFSVEDLGGDEVPPLVNLSSENGDDLLNYMEIIKEITGGDDVRVRRKFKKSVFKKLYTKMIFSYNQLPQIKQQDIALLDRVIIVDFKKTFETSVSFDEKLKKMLANQNGELESLISYLVNVLVDLKNRDFQFSYTPPTIEEKKQEYVRKTDSIKSFLEEHCEITKEDKDRIKKEDLYKIICKYCEIKGMYTPSMKKLSMELKKIDGIYSKRIKLENKRIAVWTGLKVVKPVQTEIQKVKNSTGIFDSIEKDESLKTLVQRLIEIIIDQDTGKVNKNLVDIFLKNLSELKSTNLQKKEKSMVSQEELEAFFKKSGFEGKLIKLKNEDLVIPYAENKVQISDLDDEEKVISIPKHRYQDISSKDYEKLQSFFKNKRLFFIDTDLMTEKEFESINDRLYSLIENENPAKVFLKIKKHKLKDKVFSFHLEFYEKEIKMKFRLVRTESEDLKSYFEIPVRLGEVEFINYYILNIEPFVEEFGNFFSYILKREG